jgi:hypothetical protein
MNRITVLSPLHDLMLTHGVTGTFLRKTLGVSYFIFRRLLAGERSPTEQQLHYLRSAFPDDTISQDIWDVFAPYDREVAKRSRPTTLRAGYVVAPLSGVKVSTKSSGKPPPSTEAAQRHLRSISAAAVSRHPAFTVGHYAETTTLAKTVSLSIRERQLVCLTQIAELKGITKAEVLRRLLNFVLDDVLGAPDMPDTSVGPTPSLEHSIQELQAGRLWPGEGAQNSIMDATLRAEKTRGEHTHVPAGIPAGYEKIPSLGEDPTVAARKAALQAKLDNLASPVDTPTGLEEAEASVDSSRAWGAAVLTPAGVSINPETGEVMLDKDDK